ncbi:MAG TPA: hypothetical protein DEF85_03955 [Clostridiaceae bacterium]|jgi:stage II sporulation protein P|nr:hypothetical protein [Clostridiaceae bacterium]HBF76937.1 hypothetical protein [Clostridiaceae bacterium]HBG38968.1 hypothetical protein [Clostridiaceae bacterium]HBN28363.1 hypothetical protein [Clostridiaceae bacterium]HBX48027.1 hypothetical protein [Clostridiaceae bacterium]
MRALKEVTVREEFIKLILFIVGIFIIIKLFIPILKPVSEVADKNYMRINFYQEVIGKALPPFKVITDEFEFEDEDKQDLFPLILKYLTNIDLCNPKSYIASQIPGLSLIDISSIMTKEDEPIIITTNEKETVNEGTKVASSKTEDNEKAVNVVPDNKAVNSSVNEKPKNVDSSKPIVFIFHTHTTEAYNPNEEEKKNYIDYNEINKGNYGEGICTVGEQLKSELENKYSISCIHDTTVHDFPRREGGYAKARPTIQEYLKKYPSIKLVIDLHRDGTDLHKDSVPKNRFTAIINNESYARVLFVVGNRNPNLKINLSVAQKYHAALQDMYPGFSRGIQCADAVYNQDLFGKMILLEVGSNFNTMSEALNTVKIIAKMIAADLK